MGEHYLNKPLPYLLPYTRWDNAKEGGAARDDFDGVLDEVAAGGADDEGEAWREGCHAQYRYARFLYGYCGEESDDSSKEHHCDEVPKVERNTFICKLVFDKADEAAGGAATKACNKDGKIRNHRKNVAY